MNAKYWSRYTSPKQAKITRIGPEPKPDEVIGRFSHIKYGVKYEVIMYGDGRTETVKDYSP